MRRTFPSLVALFGLITAGLFCASCYAPTYGDCAFRCGSANPVCPDEYECRTDGYCHLHDSAIVCSFASDMSTAPTQDLSTADTAGTGGS